MRHYLKVDLPELAGAKRLVEVPGLGAVINPGIYEVPEDLLPQFEQTHGYALKDANFQTGIEYVEVDDQVAQNDPRAIKASPNIKGKTKEEAEDEFEKNKADNDAREHGKGQDNKKEGDN